MPEDYRAFLNVTNGGLCFWEYAGLSIDESRRTWERLTATLDRGGFAGHEVFPPARGLIRAVKWHPGWVPFAEDGGGNLFCLDLAPGAGGVSGQVIRWEVRGGPVVGAVPRTFAEYLPAYRDLLVSGRFTFDPDCGTFDSPWAPEGRP